MDLPKQAEDALVVDLAVLPSSGQLSGQGSAYAGQVARYIQALEARIAALEARPVPAAKLQLGQASVDTRPGLSVSDVVELSRALRV